MSISKLILCVLAATAIFASSPATALAAPACPAPDPQKLVADVQAMFDAAAAGDYAAAKAHFTPDGYLFDGGGLYDADGIFNVIRDERQKGRVYLWKVTDPEVHFLCDTAWIAYVNRGGVTKDGQTTRGAWLESMILKAQGGHWLIRFAHSTHAVSPTLPYAKSITPPSDADAKPPL